MAFKIYTKTGDTGMTGLFGGARLYKSHLRIESYGTVDELNSWLGLIRDQLEDSVVLAELKSIQDCLFTIGAMLATDPKKPLPMAAIDPGEVNALEQGIDRMENGLPELKNFILPGGQPVASQCHIARCVCRRAERRIVALHQEEGVDEVILRYLNRLSDYLFVLSRKIVHDHGAAEIAWQAARKP